MDIKKGLVLKSTGSWYWVKDESTNEVVRCKIKGKFRTKGIKSTNPIAVGDLVDFEMVDKETGLIVKLAERKNHIVRKATNLSKRSHIIAANIDQAIIVVSMILPETPLEFIDRFLVTAEAYKIPAKIIFNKIDLYTPELTEYVNYISDVYENLGYECFMVSATRKINIEDIKNLLKNKVSVLSGNSGVGKSSIINAIDPDFNIKIGDISEKHLTGKHTTTFAEMYELKFGGYIIDTPGIRAFGIIDMDKELISHNFPEMFKLLPQCRFNDCLHVNEPGCAVKQAVEQGIIAEWRYNSYLSMLEGDEDKYREDVYK